MFFFIFARKDLIFLLMMNVSRLSFQTAYKAKLSFVSLPIEPREPNCHSWENAPCIQAHLPLHLYSQGLLTHASLNLLSAIQNTPVSFYTNETMAMKERLDPQTQSL